ncbi:putative toxin-antitoxin system toxin component, PIN family [Treponema sp. OMZ 840]|uniref:putative toxin-antitoxin system toxin component, PIN family n=1 Tax=Treponema sp. OMZ 840 TaxID=244313 RepID=UPI003D937A62
MKVVLDTSVLFQAMYSSKGASHAVLKLIRNASLKLSLSIPVFEEYCDVLLRKSFLELFKLNEKDVRKVLDFIALVGIKTDIYFLLRPNLRDQNDNIFVELAFASNARYIITKNIRDFTKQTELKMEGIETITPADFMKKWRNTQWR